MYKNQENLKTLTQIHSQYESDSTKEFTNYGFRILDTKYEKADLPKIIKDTCSHLSESKTVELLSLLLKYDSIFDVTLGNWKTEPVHFKLKEGSKPYHGRPFPVPQTHEANLQKEVDQMVELGILKRERKSEWAFPSFIIPKINQTVQFILDFCKLNKLLKHKPWPLKM